MSDVSGDYAIRISKSVFGADERNTVLPLVLGVHFRDISRRAYSPFGKTSIKPDSEPYVCMACPNVELTGVWQRTGHHEMRLVSGVIGGFLSTHDSALSVLLVRIYQTDLLFQFLRSSARSLDSTTSDAQ